jgi:phage baseplate assembly protein W
MRILDKAEDIVRNEDAKGIGIAFPLNGPGIFTTTTDSADQLKQNIYAYLLTNRGDRLFNPNFGADIIKLLFEQMDSEADIEDYVRTSLIKNFPQINDINVSVTFDNDRYTTNIKVTYKYFGEVDELTISIL